MKSLFLAALLGTAAMPAGATVWGGGINTASGGGVTNGSDFNGDDIVAKTITSTGTAPSLTATGAVLTSSLSVVSPGDAGQIGALTVVNNSGSLGQQIKFRHVVASSLKTFGYDNNYGAFLFSDNDAGDSATATSMLQVTRLGLMRISDAASYLSYPVPGARLHVTSTGTINGILVDGASANPFTIGTSTLVVNGNTGNLGIGTASPAFKLHVASGVVNIDGNGAGLNIHGSGGLNIGNSGADPGYFVVAPNGETVISRINGGLGVGVAPSESIEVVGGIGHYSRTIAQLLAITPSQVGVSYFCNNCSPAKLVVSTGTSAGNFADAIGGPFQ